MKTFTALLILCSTIKICIKAQQNCVTPENYYGVCSQFNSCPEVMNANRRRNQQYVLAAQRVCGGNLFCCAHPNNEAQDRPQYRDGVRQAVSSQPTNPFITQQTQQTRRRTQPARQPIAQQSQQQPSHSKRQQPPLNLRNIFNTNEFDDGFIDNRAGDTCRTPDSSQGSCQEINNCEPLLRELNARSTDTNFIEYLRRSNRNCGGYGYIVCCPVRSVRTTAPTRAPRKPAAGSSSSSSTSNSCGSVVRSFRKIVGGKASKISDWPWAVLLAYPDSGSESPFKCGGTLVSSRHVITAAHCIRRDLSYVRLGEYDLSTDSETRHEDVRISKKERHPNYNKANGRNDIGILWLDRDVRFSNTIKPICLPSTAQLRRKSYLNYNPFVVGWGKTLEGGASADVLQELQVPVLSNDVCRNSYRRINRLITEDQFDAAVICAGVLSGGKDTCQGDSGGPLMIPETIDGGLRFYLIGVVAYGVGCARPEVPGVYASVQYFIDWILAKIAS